MIGGEIDVCADCAARVRAGEIESASLDDVPPFPASSPCPWCGAPAGQRFAAVAWAGPAPTP